MVLSADSSKTTITPFYPCVTHLLVQIVFVFRGGVRVLFGRDGLGEVPQFECVVFRHGDQAGLDRVESQRAHAVKVAPQRVLWVPCLPE